MKYVILVSIITFFCSIKLKPSSDTKLFLRSGSVIATYLSEDDFSNPSFAVQDENNELLNIANVEIDSIHQSDRIFVNLNLLSNRFGFAENW